MEERTKADTVSNSELNEPLEAWRMEKRKWQEAYGEVKTNEQALYAKVADYEGISEALADENMRLRKAAEFLWDGVTDLMEQKDIDRIEHLYKAELMLLLGGL